MATLAQAAVANGANPATSVAAVFGSNVTAGSRLVVVARTSVAVTMVSGMVTDTLGLTWGLDQEFSNGNFGDLGYFSAIATSSGPCQVTFNPVGSARLGIVIREFSNLGAYGSQQNSTEGNSTAPASGNITPSAASGVAIATLLSTPTPTWESDYATGAVGDASNGRIFSGHKLISSTATENASATITSAAWFMALAWYPDASGGAAPWLYRNHTRTLGAGFVRTQ